MSTHPAWFDTARYLSLATHRKDGREVRTPVWFACDGAALVLFSAGDAGKVKRVRRTGAARIAPCDVRGSLVGGEAGAAWKAMSAELITAPAEVARAHRALRAKYGVQLWVLDVFARIGGRVRTRAYIRLR